MNNSNNGVNGRGVGGIRAQTGSSTLRGTISAGNTRTLAGGSDVDGGFSSGGYNLIGIGDFSSGFNQPGDQAGTTATPISARLGLIQASANYTVSGNILTLNLSAVANAQTLQITLNNVTVGSANGDVFIPMSVLLGDTTRNGSVTASDIGLTKSLSGQAVSAATFFADVTANDGSITASDIGQVKAQSGTTLP